MKKSNLIIGMAAAIVLASCSGGNETKQIEPTATEFISGELAKYIEVEDEPAELSYFEQDGSIPTQYIRLKVTLRMKQDGLKDVDPQDIDFTSLMSVATINLVDEDGIETVDVDVKDDELLKLKKLLTGDQGDTEEIVFEGQFNNRKDAPKWFKNTTGFTPYLSADIQVSDGSPLVVEEDVYGETTSETTDEETESSYDTYGDDTDDMSYESDDDDTDATSDETGGDDIDAMLDSYEEFVDEYISYVKKAANGDVSALAQYPKVMAKAEALDKKIKSVKSDLTSSQMQRYMKITAKMTKAAQDLN